jgi:hypothetical protein
MNVGIVAAVGFVILFSSIVASSLYSASSSPPPSSPKGGGTAAGPSAPGATAAPKVYSDGSVDGAPLTDPTQGGKCKLAQGRGGACGTTNCTTFPKCSTYKWMGYDKFVLGTIDKPTGITDKSAAISGGLDPKQVLNIVNKVRAEVGSPPIKWDDNLACASAAWIPLTSYDVCPHGAAPNFPYYAQVVGSHTSPSATPMQVLQYAVEEQFFKQEKALADPMKVTANSEKATANPDWKLGTFNDTIDERIGHYVILTSSQARCCGFSFGYNHTRSGYVRPPQDKMALVVGHFA